MVTPLPSRDTVRASRDTGLDRRGKTTVRMWNIPPRHLCRQHLLGEHVEMHMFAGTLLKGISIAGYIRDGLVETRHIIDRHDELVAEMLRRGYNHNSPMPEFAAAVDGRVVIAQSYRDLLARCDDCRERMPNYVVEKYG